MLFHNNDKPGVMLSSAVRQYVDRFAVSPGQRVALCTTNDDAYQTALLLAAHGVEVVAVADARSEMSEMAEQVSHLGIRVMTNTLPAHASGWHRVSSLTVMTEDNAQTFPCDCVGVSGGYSPDVHLSSQSGSLPVWNEELVAFVPGNSLRRERSAGSANGDYSLAVCLSSGHAAGMEAAGAAAGASPMEINATPSISVARAAAEPQNTFATVWQCPSSGKKKKSFVDFQNDVTAEDIRLAEQEGYRSVEHAKRYTTLGMATDQGKTANVNGVAILAQARGEPIPDVGTTRYRPPYSPVAIGAFAGHERGREFQPIRYTAMHACHEKLGAVFVEAGQWLRPQYYPQPGEGVMESIYRESKQVRETVGLCDVSTLGKIEIFGTDAVTFLQRLYINGWQTLQPGKARYGIMLRDDGYVYDDGTTSCLGENHYFMTTTTANAAGVLAHMEHASQVLWPELDVAFCSATEQWCGVAVAGPNARALMQDTFGESIEITDENIPFMAVREFDWNGVPTRIFRISFSGEHAYEVNVPWGYGETMWNSLYAAGEAHGVIAYGTEALSVLRIEKGHVAGNELDGRTTAADMGLGRMMSTKKHFLGLPMTQRDGFNDPERATLVGVKLVGNGEAAQEAGADWRLRGGAHLVEDAASADAYNSLGWVTSVCDSPQVGSWIGLAYLKGGLDRYEGKRLSAWYPLKDEARDVEICHPVFFDPDGERLRG